MPIYVSRAHLFLILLLLTRIYCTARARNTETDDRGCVIVGRMGIVRELKSNYDDDYSDDLKKQ